ncbi:TIGR03086 family protein, partial [Streptomyces sp. SID10244]|nr:TIGR03086 family protein [Streptomyces sp. SID10244]
MADSIVGLSPAERHRVVADDFAAQIAAVSDWDAASPVDGWVARDVVAHLVEWFP